MRLASEIVVCGCTDMQNDVLPATLTCTTAYASERHSFLLHYWMKLLRLSCSITADPVAVFRSGTLAHIDSYAPTALLASSLVLLTVLHLRMVSHMACLVGLCRCQTDRVFVCG